MLRCNQLLFTRAHQHNLLFYKCSKKLYLRHINQTGFALKKEWLQNIYLDAIMSGDPIDSYIQLILIFRFWLLDTILNHSSRFVISELYKCNTLLRGTCNLIYSLRYKFNNRMDKRDVLKFSHIAFYVQFHSFLLLL